MTHLVKPCILSVTALSSLNSGRFVTYHTKFYQDLASAGFFVTETVPLIVPTQNGEIWFAIHLGLSMLKTTSPARRQWLLPV